MSCCQSSKRRKKKNCCCHHKPIKKPNTCCSKTSPHGWRNISACKPEPPCEPPCDPPCKCYPCQNGALCCNQSCIYHKREVCDPGCYNDPWDPPIADPPVTDPNCIPDPPCIHLCEDVCTPCEPTYVKVCTTSQRVVQSNCEPCSCNPCGNQCYSYQQCGPCGDYQQCGPNCGPCGGYQQCRPNCGPCGGYQQCRPNCGPCGGYQQCGSNCGPCGGYQQCGPNGGPCGGYQQCGSNCEAKCDPCEKSCDDHGNPCVKLDPPCPCPQSTGYDKDIQCFDRIGQVFVPVASVCISNRHDFTTIIEGSFGWMQTEEVEGCPEVLIRLVMDPFDETLPSRIVMDVCDITENSCEERDTNFRFVEENPQPVGSVHYTLFLMTPEGFICNTTNVCLTGKVVNTLDEDEG